MCARRYVCTTISCRYVCTTISNMNIARACSSYGDFIDRGRLLTEKLVDQGYTIEKLKIYFRKFYRRYNDLLQHYNTPLSQSWCDLIFCWCVLHTPDLTSPDMTGYTVDSTVGAWTHQVKFTLPGHLFTHLGFPSVRVVFSVTFIPVFVMIMD